MGRKSVGATSIDRGDGHLEEAGTWNRACRHIALFLWWAGERGLAAPLTDLARLRKAPVAFFSAECDGKLRDDDFSDDGAAFADAAYRAYTHEVEAYAKRLGVDGYHIPPNRATATHFFGWLDARFAAWRAKHPAKVPKKKATPRKLPFLMSRHKLGVKQPGFEATFGPLLVDDDDQVRADAVEVLDGAHPAWARRFVPQLRQLVERDAQKRRSTLTLGPALRALGHAQTDEALEALLELGKAGFAMPIYRACWLGALGRFRAPAAKRILQSFATSKDPNLRISANAGLLRNGDRRALPRLRALLDEDFDRAREAAREIHLLLETPFVFNESQLARLIRFWDTHPEEIQRRFEALQTR